MHKCGSYFVHVPKGELGIMVEEILLDPVYVSFLESAFVLSDDYGKGLIKDITSYNQWCRAIAWQISGEEFKDINDFIATDDIPVVLKKH